MIGLIDADHIPYIVCYNKVGEPDKSLEEAISNANNYLQGLINGSNVDEFILFFTIGKNFRYDIYPEYKANRKNNEKPPFFNEVREYLVKEYNGIHGYNLEADDILNIYKNKYIAEQVSYIVISTDKDINNLFGLNYDIKNNVARLVDTEFAEQYFWKSVIVGKNCSL
jgi:5'-3' exonuclease